MWERRLRVGVTGPFSGARRAYGDMLKAVAEDAGRDCELVFCDDRATPQEALTVAKLFVRERVDAVIGHFNSDCARAAGPLYREAGIAFLMPASTAPDLVAATGGIRICPADGEQVAAMDRWLAENGVQACIEQDGTAYAARIAALLETALAARPQQAAQARKVRVVLGTHVAVAAAILATGRESELFLVPDDCAVAQFDELLASGGRTVFVTRPSPSYARAAAIAFELALKAWRDPSGVPLRSALLARGEILNGKYIDTEFRVVPLTSTASLPAARLLPQQGTAAP